MSLRITESVDLNKLADGYKKKRRLPDGILTEIVETIESYLWIKLANLVVDIGSGTGRFLLPLAERNPDVSFVGIDKAKGMLDKCSLDIKNKKLKNVSLVEADLGDKILFGDGKVDSVILYHVLHIVEDKVLLVNELRRILKKGGRLLVASTSHSQLKNTWNYKYMPKILDWELRRTPDTSEIVKMLKSGGFKLVGVKEINVKKYFSSVDEWINFFRLRPISILSGLSDDELEDQLEEAGKRLIRDLGENISFEYGFDCHTQLFFEKL
jgi:ubiquinone/menaquinone biosynthesis C-methylase UbiE